MQSWSLTCACEASSEGVSGGLRRTGSGGEAMSDPSCIATAAAEPAAAATAPGRAAASCLIRRCEGVSVSCSHAALTAPDQASWSQIILGSREIQNLTVSQSLKKVKALSLETLCFLRTKQGPSSIPVCMACPFWGRLHIPGHGECLTVQRRKYSCLISVFMACSWRISTQRAPPSNTASSGFTSAPGEVPGGVGICLPPCRRHTCSYHATAPVPDWGQLGRRNGGSCSITLS